ncbi:MAG: hypothetical protein D8H97_11085 [Neisseria sp.]|nr:MAG: hypothetical protein D8H97_11085 [Neisseria sp.]
MPAEDAELPPPAPFPPAPPPADCPEPLLLELEPPDEAEFAESPPSEPTDEPPKSVFFAFSVQITENLPFEFDNCFTEFSEHLDSLIALLFNSELVFFESL